MQIESGKYYKTRDGRVVGPMIDNHHHEWRWIDNNDLTYRDDGSWKIERITDKHDLIAPAYPETGTLQEIGAKVGDVVLYVGDGETTYNAERKITGTHENGKTYHDDQHWGGSVSMRVSGPWRIISRASETKPSPVRTVTTTRKEIVPGVYGRVVVERESNGDMVTDARNMQTAAELTEAIATLTEIRDAMVQE